MSGEPSGATSSSTGEQPSDLLAWLQIYYDALRRDEDSLAAWFGLSEVFAALEDDERVRNCRNVALRLKATSASPAALLH